MPRKTSYASPTALEPLEPRVLLDSTATLDHTVFYPEGYAHDQVSEIVIIANQGLLDAEYELWARYETGERDQILASGIIEAGHRQDITLTAAGGAAGRVVRSDTPFSLELKASEPLTATLRHDDFGGSTAEDFSDDLSRDWAFPSLLKSEHDRDFIVLHNPSDDPVIVQLTGYDDSGQRFVLSRTVGPHRRSGWNINATQSIPRGDFAVLLTASSPVIAALSHYSASRDDTDAFTALGAQDGGARAGAILSLEFEDRLVSSSSHESDTLITIFNPAATPATIELHFLTRDTPAGTSSRTVTVSIEPLVRDRVSLRSLGFSSAEHLSLIYSSSQPVAVSARVERSTAVFGVSAQVTAATQWLFTNAAFDRVEPDGRIRTEDVFVFNPTSTSITVTFDFTFTNGQVVHETKTLAPHEVEDVDARLNLVIGGALELAYTVTVRATSPIVASLEHWSVPTRGGFTTSGAPAGTIANLASSLTL